MEPSGSCSEDICAGARKVRESGSRADNTGVRFSHSLLGRWLPVVALTAVGAAAAAGYAYTAADRYRATAQLIVSPVSASDPTYLGLGLLRDTGGKRTAAASAAVLLRSAQVADAVRTELGLTRSRDSLLSALHAHAVGSSDIVDVTVEDTSAVRAAQLANAFANAVVSQRTASFQSQLTTAIRRAEQQLLALPPNQRAIGAGAVLQQRLTVLRSLQGQPDPTIRPAAQAEAPTAAIGPRRPLLVGIGAAVGFVVGLLVVAFLALPRRRLARRGARLCALRRSSCRPARRRRAVAGSEAAGAGARGAGRRAGRTRATGRRERGGARAPHGRARGAGGGAGAPHRRARDPHRDPRGRSRRARGGSARGRRAGGGRAGGRGPGGRGARPGGGGARGRGAGPRGGGTRGGGTRPPREREAAEREAAEREAAERAAQRYREAEEREAAERAAADREAAERARPGAGGAARRRRHAPPRPPRPPEPALPGVPLYRADAAPANGSARGHWNLTELERLVEERGREFPERIDEWASYLFFLRDYAEPDGSVPASFDWLIEDEFAELV